MRTLLQWFCAIGLFFLWSAHPVAQEVDLNTLRVQASKLFKDGNYKESLQLYQQLALSPTNQGQAVGGDLNQAIQCLAQLNRVNEIDEFREQVIQLHAANWHLLSSAAHSYLYGVDHNGYIIAGEFTRGQHRGGGEYANAFVRDRVRALQLFWQALPLASQQANATQLAQLHLQIANALVYHQGRQSWRLQYLTDLSALPDYAIGYYYDYYEQQYAPTHADGSPVFYYVPLSLEQAQSDGERWRWFLTRAMEVDPSQKPHILFQFARFLYEQFGVQTLAQWRYWFVEQDAKEKDSSHLLALHTLKENETIAKLASGIRRFTLPDEFNYIKIFQQLATDKSNKESSNYLNRTALQELATIFENRMQYPKAVDCLREILALYQQLDTRDPNTEKRLQQIIGNWGRFESSTTQPAGRGAALEFVFRNGKKVQLEAFALKTRELLEDVKNYLKTNPSRFDWQQINLGDIGYRIVQQNQQKYIGEKVASWSLDLQPREDHFDKSMEITTPLQKPGAYYVTAKMQDGNESRIIVWIADTVIVNKPGHQQPIYYVADAVTGKPIAKANLELFGYRTTPYNQNEQKRLGRDNHIDTTQFAEYTNEQGLAQLKQKDLSGFQWLITATTADGRFAFLGFSHYWYGNYYDYEYNQTKSIVITDRPVYRPKQEVQFKVWVRHAQYDQANVSQFANQNFKVEIRNPQNEKIYEKTLKADEYAGINDSLVLDEEAKLGIYSILVSGAGYQGGNFRVEEYKKPEFEVTIEAPKKPIALGDKISATIQAKYYFGAPVVAATVKYKVLRTQTSTNWYPYSPWDWFYGPGYWWFAYDYTWYPGWHRWGCFRPIPWWWQYDRTPPEVVMENEVPIGADGTISIEIDTAIAKAIYGDKDQKYQITAEVTDQSRRTIVGQGQVLVASEPFKVYAWTHKGHYQIGDVIQASFSARTLDNQPVQGTGVLRLLKIDYDKDFQPKETEVQTWDLDTNAEGHAQMQMTASEAGQYRLSYKLTDSEGHTQEGGYIFIIRGEGFDGAEFRFNALELIPDQRDYQPGDKLRLMVNTNHTNSTVLLFWRPANGVYLMPKVLAMQGKSTVEEITISAKDMPNFFIEALTVYDGKVYTEVKEIVVPPAKRTLQLEVTASAAEYKPGEKASIDILVKEENGEPFMGSLALTVYDKAVEYISGGSNVPEIREFFWKWRRHHYPATSSSLDKYSYAYNLLKPNEVPMSNVGQFGRIAADFDEFVGREDSKGRYRGVGGNARKSNVPMSQAVMEEGESASSTMAKNKNEAVEDFVAESPDLVEPTVRTQFADTAFWVATLNTDQNGHAQVELKMPENLTTWKIRTWGMGHGTKVGQAEAEIITTKDLLLRLQAPRFFLEKDEVVLSANVHNYLENAKDVKVILEMDGDCLELISDKQTQNINILANSEQRVDWRVRVLREGEAVIRMKALTDEESDAMEMRFPVYVHGMDKMVSFSGVIRPNQEKGSMVLYVPAERRVNDSRLEIRYSPSLAGAMVDALPYLADYPYGCTEQTLNRFLPTVISQKILLDMGLDLQDIKQKRTNLNAQEIGDDAERAKQWKHWERNPVFDHEEVEEMVKVGLRRLYNMQNSDGGWGWFYGPQEQSSAHTTAVVVHGLQIAQQNDVAILPDVMNRGISWLKNYQDQQVLRLKNAPEKIEPYKHFADNIDALVYMVLVDAAHEHAEMRDFLYRDRTHLAVYGMSMFGLALHKQGQSEKLSMILRNIEQYLVEDAENQTAYLNLPNGSYWWYWYGSEFEAHAYYLKLLAKTNPQGEKAAGLVKYLLNNRKHASYWNSTRDTAICIEAMAEYLRTSGEDQPNLTLEIWLDGKKHKEVSIDKDNLFSFDNKLVLLGDAIETGEHTVELRKRGQGPVYFNAYLSYFTLEDYISKTGLEIKVERNYYQLIPADKTIKASGSHGQVVDQKVEKYERKPISDLQTLKSGDLVEIELVIESKNDYEYLIFEDMKPAGFEPVEVRSGYIPNAMRAYVELRDEKVAFFVQHLARGKHSLAYRMRAEIPGKFSALPTKAYAMYAPELRANSDEIKIRISD